MYKPCRPVDWYTSESNPSVPKTTTQEMLEMGQKKENKMKIISRKQLNFQSYPMNDFRFDLTTFDRPKHTPITSSYSRDYAPPNDFYVCPPKGELETEPDPVFNRKPPNVFGMRQTTNYKFMDDHFLNVSESRKKIDFVRQMRNTHYKLV